MHDPAPAFSVIVPLYDCERYVEECLESLKAQTFPDFEALVVNDASPDNSPAIARRIAGSDERFRFFDMPENRGLAAVRNRGLDEARGNIVVFLDSDDLLAPCALEHMEKRFREQNLDDLYFNAESFYEDAKARKMLVEDFSGRDSFEGVASGTELFTASSVTAARTASLPKALSIIGRGALPLRNPGNWYLLAYSLYVFLMRASISAASRVTVTFTRLSSRASTLVST